RRIIAEGLKTLAERERAAVVLREIEGLTTSEVARILGVAEETVRSQVSTGKAKLRAFAERYERRRP
ncbi:MAG: sigma-70 family RNA polymerase sigma factor, partial [Acidobacteria bacterium]|nr:sigma-70 family RNA polymerase sigma factor [Acidobacteriota bacterium]